MSPFQSLREYEVFVYGLAQQFSQLTHSTLTVIQRGKYRAEVMGDLFFAAEVRLSVYEHITWDKGRIEIEEHIPPEVRHHRVPAPMLSFIRPNLTSLIVEIAGSEK